MNVLRYCNLDESLQGEESLVCLSALERLFKTKELDYMSYIVLRMFENTEVGNLLYLFHDLDKLVNLKTWVGKELDENKCIGMRSLEQ